MALIYGIDEFKAKLKTCGDSSDVRIVYTVITDQVAHFKKEIDELRQKLEEKEARLAEINLDEYKAAMSDRVRELASK